MNKNQIGQIGDELYDALRKGYALTPVSERFDDFSIDDAYRVSLHILDCRLAAGELVVGKKIGLTSKVVQKMLGVHQPDFGFLTDAMWLDNGTTASLSMYKLQQARAEGELAFKLKTDLVGPGVTEADVFAATESVMPCFEIVDSRVKDWKINIEDTVADNASCGVFVVGEACTDFHNLDLSALQMTIFKNGEKISTGEGTAVLGNPLTAVTWLANTLGEFGIPFQAGEIILSGSFVPMDWVQSGDKYEVTIDGLGRAAIQFVD